MRKFRYILLLAAIFGATSCVVDNVEYQGSINNTDAITVIGRMTRFTDHSVTTRGTKDEAEALLTSMAMAIFPVNDAGTALAGNCVYWQYTDNQAELLFTVDRGSNYTYNARYAMYVFCNMDMSEFGIGSTLDAMLAKSQDVEGINIPKNGFPMVGSLGDTFSTTFNKDNQVFILSPTNENDDLIAPTVNGTTQTLLTIPMQAMYAKVNFTIGVTPDQSIEGNYSSKFDLYSYTINNVPSSVDFKNTTNSDSKVLNDSFTVNVNSEIIGSNKVKFTFYLPERLLTPATTWDKYTYPFAKGTYSEQIDSDKNGYRDEDEKYMQRFKGKLVGSDQKATNIVISGRFRDHQNHYWDIDYTIHLGEDNYGDFNVRRNYEYDNVVTIRGIQSSSDMSENEDAISIDHRVNVERTQPAIISLRRETLLDSHFEVRPLRVRKSDIGSVGDINAVKVEVVDPTTTNWMRLERSGGVGTTYENVTNDKGESIYITDEGPSKGKRRYFTYDLCTGTTATNSPLTNSTEVILPLSDETECCWIYVDECTEVGDGIRAGIVRVTYGNLSDSSFTPTTDTSFPQINYVINQRKLFQVTGVNTYNIEYEEEYLHNFDADDDYGQTDYEGMQWGLDGVQLSHLYKAFFVSGSIADDLVNGIIDQVGVYYDFYLPDDISEASATRRSYSGYIFVSEVIDFVGDTYFGALALNKNPDSAIEYCYNKNKRDKNGNVYEMNWYLPAIDEVEDIMMSKYDNNSKYAYARFSDFQNKYYWSSQSAFYRNRAHYWTNFMSQDFFGDYYIDDDTGARATKVAYTNDWSTVTSGHDGYKQGLKIDAPASALWSDAELHYYDVPFSYNYTVKLLGFLGSETRTHSVQNAVNKTNHPGNKLRTDYARVRCVRKQ